MAITETMVGNKCNVLLNNGTSASGSVQTVTISLGTLAASTWDATKAMAVIEDLSDVLSKSVYSVQHVITNEVTD